MTETRFTSGDITIAVNEKGQLVSLLKENMEFMHQGGREYGSKESKASWGNSDLVMCPVIGPTKHGWIYVPAQVDSEHILHAIDEYVAAMKENPGLPELPAGTVPVRMGQHGLLRWMTPEVEKNDFGILVRWDYQAPDAVVSGKTGEEEYFLKDFSVEKEHSIEGDSLITKLRVYCENTLPIGWHPSFQFGEREGKLFPHLDLSGKALTFKQSHEGNDFLADGETKQFSTGYALYADVDRMITIDHDFPFTAVWCRGNQFCLEPISHLMVDDANTYFLDAYNSNPAGVQEYTVKITPQKLS